MTESRLPMHVIAATLRARLCYYDVSVASQEPIAGAPIICVGNHVCSLDSWIAYDVTMRQLGKRFLHIGDITIVRRHPYLKRFGVLPVSGADPVLTMQSISVIGHALRSDSGCAAWIFPTGSHAVSCNFSGEIQRGVQALARVSGEALIVPVGLQYYVYRRPRVSVWVHIGRPIASARELSRENWGTAASQIRQGIEDALQTAIEHIEARTAGTHTPQAVRSGP